MVGLGRTGSLWIWVLYMKTLFFCSMDCVPKINTNRDMRCCELSYVTAEEGSATRATQPKVA